MFGYPTIFNQISHYKMYVKSIPIDDETKALVAKVRKAWIDLKPTIGNKHPFSTPKEDAEPYFLDFKSKNPNRKK